MNLREMQTFLEKASLSQLKEAMSRTEFFQFMKKGIKGLIVDAYSKQLQKTTYQELVVVEESDSNNEDYPTMGAPSLPRLVPEGQAFDVLNSGSPDNVQVTNNKFGGIIELNSEAAQDDKTPMKSLRRQSMELGPNHAKHKDKTYYSIITGNGNIYDGQNFFSLNHPGFTGGAARGDNDNIFTNVTLSANALATVLGIIAVWEGADPDQDIDVTAERLVVPVTLQQTAHGLINTDLLPFAMGAGTLGPAATISGGMPNMMKGKLALTVSYRLDRVSLTDWYVKTEFPGLIHQPREGLEVTAEAPNSGESFRRDVMRWRSKERYGSKVLNWRWGVLVS